MKEPIVKTWSPDATSEPETHRLLTLPATPPVLAPIETLMVELDVPEIHFSSERHTFKEKVITITVRYPRKRRDSERDSIIAAKLSELQGVQYGIGATDCVCIGAIKTTREARDLLLKESIGKQKLVFSSYAERKEAYLK